MLLALERMFNVKCMLLCSNDMKLVVTLSEGHKMLTGQSPDSTGAIWQCLGYFYQRLDYRCLLQFAGALYGGACHLVPAFER